MRIRFAEQNDMDWLISQLKLFSAFYGSAYSLFGDEEYSYDIYFDLLGDYHNYLYQNKDGYAKKH